MRGAGWLSLRAAVFTTYVERVNCYQELDIIQMSNILLGELRRKVIIGNPIHNCFK